MTVALALLFPASVTPPPLASQAVAPLDFAEAWRWVDFTIESGLPDAVINDLAEVGPTVWIATSKGAAWYDGFQWSMVPSSLGLPPGPTTSVAPDGRGGVLVVAGGRLFRGGRTGFQPVPIQIDGDTAPPVGTVLPLPGDELLVLLDRVPSDAELVRVDVVGRTRRVPVPARVNADLGRGLWRSDDGSLWLTTVDGLFRQAPGTESWRNVLPSPGGEQRVTDLTRTSDGRMYAYRDVPFSAPGLLTWRDGERPRLIASEGANTALSLASTPDNGVIAVYETSDVRVLQEGDWRSLATVPPQMLGATFTAVRPNGDIWVGRARGLALYRRSSSRWTRREHAFPDPTSRANVLMRGAGGAVWVGTAGGVELREPDGGVRNYPVAAGRPLTTITGLGEHPEGVVWVSSGGSFDGLFRFDGAWSYVGPEQGLASRRVHRVFPARDGGLWLAALGDSAGRGRGFYRFDGTTARRVWDDAGPPPGRSYSVAEGSDGSVWFGWSGGLSRLRNGAWTHWPAEAAGMRRGAWDVEIDASGRLWFTDRLVGIGYVDESDSIRRLGTEDGLLDAEVWDITLGRDGELWMSSVSGLARFRDGIWSSFDHRSGLTPVWVWPILPLEDRLLLGTAGGGVVELDRMEETNPPPRIDVRPVVIDEGVVHLAWDVRPWWGEIPASDVESRWRVDGEPWSQWSRTRTVSVGNLAAGAHSLTVQAKGLFGQLDPAGTVVTFTVPHALFLRPVFAVPVGSLLLALVGLAVLGTVRRRRADAAIRQSEEQFRTLVEHAPEALVILDAQTGRFVGCNQNALDLFGLSRQELSRAGPADVSPPRQPDGQPSSKAALRHVEAALAGELPVFEWIHRGADGSHIPCEVRLVRLPSKDRRLIRGSIVDISARKEAEERQRELETQLQQAQRLQAVGQLTGGIAHDFNNLLTVIMGNIELLEESLGEAPSLGALAEQARRSAERGAMLTQRLLAFSRRQPLRPRSVDLNDLLAGMMDLLNRSIGETVRLEVLPAHDLWACEVDPTQMENAILNLAINARDAMPAGGHLRFRTENQVLRTPGGMDHDPLVPGEYVVLTVSDTGEGMEPEVAARAVEPFFTTKEVGEGSGLGLSMVYGFVRQSGGGLELSSRVGSGTTVRMRLPRAGATREGGAGEQEESREQIPTGQGEVILVVEDDPGVRALSGGLIERLGYRPIVAENGPRALEILRHRTDVELLFTDVVLPGGLTGPQLAEQARRLVPGLRVLYTSGYAEDALVHHGRLPAGVELLEKPFSRSRLATALAESLGRATA